MSKNDKEFYEKNKIKLKLEKLPSIEGQPKIELVDLGIKRPLSLKD